MYYDDDYYDSDYESPYAGTYVHDVEGWSDDAIGDALDGDPEAYWNIDKMPNVMRKKENVKRQEKAIAIARAQFCWEQPESEFIHLNTNCRELSIN